MPNARDAPLLGRAAADLVLRLLDLPEPVVSGTVLEDHFHKAGRELIERGLLRPHHHDRVAVPGDDGDDTPVALVASPFAPDLGFFSPVRGWVMVPPDRLRRYRVDTDAVIAIMTERLDLQQPSPADRTVPLSPHLWDLGTARLASGGPAASI